MTNKAKGGRPRTRPDFSNCEHCGNQYKVATVTGNSNRRYCGRDCYLEAKRAGSKNPYPKIYVNGKRVYLHRHIYAQAHPEIELTPEDIIHHKDENPFNREIDNLELIRGEDARLKHLAEHNYHRGKTGRKKDTSTYDPEFGF